MAAHRYWRIFVNANNGATSTSIAEIELRLVYRGPDQTSNTPSKSISGGSGSEGVNQEKDKAFDGNLITAWQRSAASNCWVGWDFGSGNSKDIGEVALQALTTAGGFSATKLPKDFTVDYSDDAATWTTALTVTGETGWTSGEQRTYLLYTPLGLDDPQVQQSVVYAIGSFPAEQARTSQVTALTTGAAETSNGLFLMKSHQVVAYALVKPNGDYRKLRAWTFPQDDHKFYVLQLGNRNGTLVYDLLTGQWAKWKSADEVFWRGQDGCAWEGFNVTCDTNSGKIFQIDPDGRLDWNDTTSANDTPIISVVVGGTTERFRNNVPCFMAELAVSEGQPPSGIDASTVGLSLRSSDTLGWYDHGSLTGLASGERLTVRWYGLGLMGSPGRIFEITDTGYARRIDGLNIEVGNRDGQ